VSNQLFRRKTLQQITNEAEQNQLSEHRLKKTLNLRDLTALGIAAIIGAGIFSTIGNAKCC
jgi:APA family basic amino acid/polyamine antiporter